VAEICREHDISETLLRRRRDQMIEAGAGALRGGPGPLGSGRAAPGRKAYELEISG
jgi:transposase-like protein